MELILNLFIDYVKKRRKKKKNNFNVTFMLQNPNAKDLNGQLEVYLI